MIEGLNKETLKRLYITEQKSLNEIAEIFGRSYTLVRHKCIQYKIKLRPNNYKIIKCKKSVLLRLYVQEDKPPREIAQMFSCTPETVRNRFREYGIPLKDNKVKGLNKARLQKLYVNEGKSIQEIAKIIGCSHETVRKRCMQHGIKLRQLGSRITGADKSALQRLYVKEGKSLSKIAEMFSCSPPTVRSRCREYGIKLRGRKIKGLSKSTLQKLYIKEGKSLDKIAEMFSCSPSTVGSRCKEYGIKTRRGRSKKLKGVGKALRIFYFDKGHLERLDRLSAKTRVPKTVYMRDAINLVLKKYERQLKGRTKKKRRVTATRGGESKRTISPSLPLLNGDY